MFYTIKKYYPKCGKDVEKDDSISFQNNIGVLYNRSA